MTDGRFSGATHGFMVGHIAPEAAVRGPIAALRDGDTISFDVKSRRLDAQLSTRDFAERLKDWVEKPSQFGSGVMSKYAKLVSSAAKGAVTKG